MNPEQSIADIQTQLQEAEAVLNTVELRKYELKKELVEVMEGIRKAQYVISKLRLEEKIATRLYWQGKNP